MLLSMLGRILKQWTDDWEAQLCYHICPSALKQVATLADKLDSADGSLGSSAACLKVFFCTTDLG